MHGSESGLQCSMHQEHIHRWSGNVSKNTYLKRTLEEYMDDEVQNVNWELDSKRKSA